VQARHQGVHQKNSCGRRNLWSALHLHVSGDVDLLRELGDLDSEALLHLLQDGLILGTGNEGDGKTLGTETTSTAYSVQILITLWDKPWCARKYEEELEEAPRSKRREFRANRNTLVTNGNSDCKEYLHHRGSRS
jgi:hypothetical protein